MPEKSLKELFDALADAGAEAPGASLRGRIMEQIPEKLPAHGINWGTLRIVVDLRISWLAAAAAIAVATLVLANLFGGVDAVGGGVYGDGRLLVRYCLSGSVVSRGDAMENLSRLYEQLVLEGRDVVYYGESADPEDRNAILMYWRLPDQRYTVVLNDMTVRTLSPNALIRLQSCMLERERKR